MSAGGRLSLPGQVGRGTEKWVGKKKGYRWVREDCGFHVGSVLL